MIPDAFVLDRSVYSRNPGPRLVAGALECAGYDILAVPRAGDWLDLGWLRRSRPNLIHVERLSGIDDVHGATRRGFWPPEVTGARRQATFSRWLAGLESLGIPIVWHVDGTCLGGTGESRPDDLNNEVHKRMFDAASGLVVHEESCARAVFELLGETKNYTVAPLGDFGVVFGLPKEKQDCRHRLGLPHDKKILLAAIRSGDKESLRPLVEAVHTCGAGRALLVFVCIDGERGRRLHDTSVVREYGPVSNPVLRDLVCAADFVVDTRRTLTSGMLRLALSYSTAVIACKFASALDMCAGAAVFVEDAGGLERGAACAIGMAEAEYLGMTEEASARNRERTWKAAGARMASLYADLMK